MVGMPLLNLGYALGGLSQGYNQQQQQAMQRAAQQLAIQQALSQQNAQRLAARGLQAGLLGQGGGLGGFGRGFGPGNIQPVSQPGIPSMPSQAPVPPALQQPPPAQPDTPTDTWSQQSPWWAKQGGAPTQEQLPDSAIPADRKEEIPLDDGAQGPQGAVGPSGPPGAISAPSIKSVGRPDTAGNSVVTMSDGSQKLMSAADLKAAQATPDITPAPGPSSDATPSHFDGTLITAPASTTSDAPGGTGGGAGDEFAIKIPGGPSIPMSQFFGSVDYGHLAQGIAKLAPPGTDQADIYQAVVDLSKLAEGNKTQQQQAGLILRELIKQPFDLEKIDRRAAGQSALEDKRQTGRETLQDKRQTGRETLEGMRERFRADSRQRSEDFRTLMQKRSFDHADLVRVNNHAQKLEDEAAKRGLDAPKRQAQLIRQEINSYVNRYVDLTSSKTPTEVKQRVEALIRQLDQLNTQLFNTGPPAD